MEDGDTWDVEVVKVGDTWQVVEEGDEVEVRGGAVVVVEEEGGGEGVGGVVEESVGVTEVRG